MFDNALPPPPPTTRTAEQLAADRQATLTADLTIALTWIRQQLGLGRWHEITERMALLPGSPPDRIASLVSAAVSELGADTTHLLLGLLDEVFDDLVMARPHRRLFPLEVDALERLREALARV